MSRLHTSAALVAFLLGCTASNVGSPCDTDEQCGGDLICDVHDGKGTCQPAHDHPADTEDHDTEHATEDHVTTGEHATEHDDHGTTHDTGDDVAAVCTDYCACLQTQCTAHEQFPHADLAACETACAGFTAAERDCWAEYCALAEKGDEAQEHYCEHASGQVGLEECA